jgi:hypothetical protein
MTCQNTKIPKTEGKMMDALRLALKVLIANTFHPIFTGVMTGRKVGLQFWLFGHLVITGH